MSKRTTTESKKDSGMGYNLRKNIIKLEGCIRGLADVLMNPFSSNTCWAM